MLKFKMGFGSFAAPKTNVEEPTIENFKILTDQSKMETVTFDGREFDISPKKLSEIRNAHSKLIKKINTQHEQEIQDLHQYY